MKYFYPLVLIAFVVSACTPLRVVRLEPENEPTSYRYGEKLLAEQQADVEVTVSYYDASKSYIVFNLEVENKGKDPINFDPAICTLVPDIGPVTRAIDPELELLSMDIQTVRDQQNSRTWAWIGAGVLVAGAVAAVASDNGSALDVTPSTFGEELALTVIDAVSFTVVDAAILRDNRQNAVPLANEIPVPENRFFWLDHALRLTTIAPGEKAFGKVVFPRNDEATIFNFQVSVEGNDFQFPFSQQVFRP